MRKKFEDMDGLVSTLKSCCSVIAPGAEILSDKTTGRVMAFRRDKNNRLCFSHCWENAIDFNPRKVGRYTLIIVDCQDEYGNAWSHVFDIASLKTLTSAQFKEPYAWIED